MMNQFLKKMKAGVVAGLLVSTVGFAGLNSAGANSAFTPQQQKALGPMIEQYLLQHPDLLMKMSNKLRERQMLAMQAAAKKTEQILLNNKNLLSIDKKAVTRGPVTAPITLVEFYDYQCSACAATYPELAKFLKTDFAKQNVRVVYRAFPFFGPASVYAAKMVIAAKAQNKDIALHDALFRSGLIEGKLSEKAVDQLAASIPGLDVTQLKATMELPWVQQEMQKNETLTKDINLQATPGFVFHPTNIKQISSGNLVFVNSGMSSDGFLTYAKKVKSNL